MRNSDLKVLETNPTILTHSPLDGYSNLLEGLCPGMITSPRKAPAFTWRATIVKSMNRSTEYAGMWARVLRHI